MTVSSTINRVQYATDGVTTAFAISYAFYESTDINAIFVGSDGTQTVLAPSTDYSVAGGAGSNGTLTTNTALPVGVLTIYRDIPFTQESDYVENDPFPADRAENDYDRAAMRDQQLLDAAARSLSYPVTVDPAVSAELPAPAGGKFLGWRSDEKGLQNLDLPEGTAVYGSIADTRTGTSGAEAVTPDSLASLWQKGADIASAATLVKPDDADLGGYHVITGSVTITNFWSGETAGFAIETRFTGAPLIEISGNIVPPGGADFQTIAGDTIRWRWDGSKLRAMGGIRADGTTLVKTAVPNFSANKGGSPSGDQTGIVSGNETKVTFTNEVRDVGGYYDAPNSKYTPPAGVYFFNARVTLTGGIVDQSKIYVGIRKNGALTFLGDQVSPSGTGNVSPGVSCIDAANGTDFYEVGVFADGTGTKTINGGTSNTYFQAVKVA
jgi:hypothetical protein